MERVEGEAERSATLPDHIDRLRREDLRRSDRMREMSDGHSDA